MEEPLTEELLDELRSAPSPQAYLEAHSLTKRDLPSYLSSLLKEKDLKQSRVVRAAGLSPTYGYQIFKGERHPSREKLLALAFAMHLDLRETNRALQAGGVSALYPKNRRDAIIIFCLEKGYSLGQANETLYAFKETSIDSK